MGRICIYAARLREFIRMNDKVDLWLAFTRALFHELKPKDAGFETCGDGMLPDDFSELVKREMLNVDAALVSMSRAPGKEDVLKVLDNLSKDTVIALFSRFAHLFGLLKSMADDDNPPLWSPPDEKDLWRVILISMILDNEVQTAAGKALWPGELIR